MILHDHGYVVVVSFKSSCFFFVVKKKFLFSTRKNALFFPLKKLFEGTDPAKRNLYKS